GCIQDLDPVRLGMDRHPSTRPMPLRREDFDRRLCRIAVDLRMPILAIGSGMQLLNVMCGGTIFQHIPEDFLKALHHRDPVESTLGHTIEIVPGTGMDPTYGPGEIRVNSCPTRRSTRSPACSAFPPARRTASSSRSKRWTTTGTASACNGT